MEHVRARLQYMAINNIFHAKYSSFAWSKWIKRTSGRASEYLFLLIAQSFQQCDLVNFMPFIWFELSRVELSEKETDLKMSVFIIYSICNHKLFYIWLLRTNNSTAHNVAMHSTVRAQRSMHSELETIHSIQSVHIAYAMCYTVSSIELFPIEQNVNSWSGMIFCRYIEWQQRQR